jgi:hypothetical protein
MTRAKSGKPLSAEWEARLRSAAAQSVAMLRDVPGRHPTIELPADADLDAVVEVVLAVSQEQAATVERLRTELRSEKGARRDGKKKVH